MNTTNEIQDVKVVNKRRNELYAQIKAVKKEYFETKYYYDHNGKADSQCEILDNQLQERIKLAVNESIYGKWGTTKTKDINRLENLLEIELKSLKRLKEQISEYESWLVNRETAEFKSHLNDLTNRAEYELEKLHSMTEAQAELIQRELFVANGLEDWTVSQDKERSSFKIGIKNQDNKEGWVFEFARSFRVSLVESRTSSEKLPQIETNIGSNGSFVIGDENSKSGYMYYVGIGIVLSTLHNQSTIVNSMMNIEEQRSITYNIYREVNSLTKVDNPRTNIED